MTEEVCFTKWLLTYDAWSVYERWKKTTQGGTVKTTTQERDKVVDLLRGALNDMYNDPTVENLDQVLRACEEALTKVKQLRRWAKLTEENEAQPSVKQAIVALVKEELKGGNTLPRWLLGSWLKDLGTLVDEYPDWVKIVDPAIDMTW